MAQPGFLQGGAKFFEQHSLPAMVNPSGSSHNGNIKVFLFGRRMVSAVLKQNVKKFNAIAHTKNFAITLLHPKAFTDTN